MRASRGALGLSDLEEFVVEVRQAHGGGHGSR
jgi:hypothetical protein